MKIDHIGIVVKSIEKGIEHWENVFEYQQLTEAVVNSRERVNVVFMSKEGSLTIKLLEPVDEKSTVYRFAMRGGGLHHLCFKCDDLSSEVQHLKNMGLRVLKNPQPGEAFDNENIAFLFAKNNLNIELIDTDKKASMLGGRDAGKMEG